ncbi:MAG: SDR family oxidoreductase [Gammaproteobacteria bacterium]
MSIFEFKGKIALVTGANRGIGEGYVRTLLNAGVKKVYAGARDLDNLSALIEQFPGKIEPVLLEVTSAEHIKALAEQIDSLDILVNNAGIADASGFIAANSVEVARQEMEVNYFAPLQITQAMLPLLRQSGQALIINISSIAGIANLPSIGPYSATKAAMHSYTQGLRAELKTDGIQVIGVYPGPIDTRMAEGFEMDKPKPEQVAIKTLEALEDEKIDVFPDDFSVHMYGLFLQHPHNLETAFSEMM